MKKILQTFFKFNFIWISIWLWFFITAFIFTKAASLTATTWTPLTASNWNNMISNFFWWSGSWGIFYNGKVGIWTSSPNKSLHIKTAAWTNAELDLQSWDLPHWAIYQDETSQDLKIRNWVNKVSISNWWALNAIGWLCINSDCKTSWSQVWWTSLWIYQFTWTSITCNTSNEGKVRYNASMKGLDYCDWTSWTTLASTLKGTQSNPWLSCKEILNSWWSKWNGTYRIKVWSNSFQVYCDMTTDGWWWTLIAKSCTTYNVAWDWWWTNLWDNEYRPEELTAWDCNGTKWWKLSDTKINSIWSNSWGKSFMCKRWDYPSDRVKNTNMNNWVFVWNTSWYDATLWQDYNSYTSVTSAISVATNNYFWRWNTASDSWCSALYSTNRWITARTRGNNWGNAQWYYFVK